MITLIKPNFENFIIFKRIMCVRTQFLPLLTKENKNYYFSGKSADVSKTEGVFHKMFIFLGFLELRYNSSLWDKYNGFQISGSLTSWKVKYLQLSMEGKF